MSNLIRNSLSCIALAMPAGLARAHHEAGGAAAGETLFLVIAGLTIAVGVFMLQPQR